MKIKDNDIKVLTRFIAHYCVRNNTILENLHAGKSLPKKYLSYSRISDEEMRNLMLGIETNIIKVLKSMALQEKDDNLGKLFKAIRELYKNGVSWDRKM